jgi:hypothetical protein
MALTFAYGGSCGRIRAERGEGRLPGRRHGVGRLRDRRLAMASGSLAALPGAIWPRLVQMGSGRGGAYTYNWTENLLGLRMHSTDRVPPEFQGLAVGDVLPLPNGPALRAERLAREPVSAAPT